MPGCSRSSTRWTRATSTCSRSAARAWESARALAFSSYPSQVEVHVDGRFHSFAGCAMESIALSRMPPFAGKEIRLESYCACCLAPVTIVARDGELLSRTPASVLIDVSTSPREWNTTSIVCMCDSMNFVLDGEHALVYERVLCRRGVLFTLEQAQRF